MEILGHNSVLIRLSNMFKQDRLHHCLLFEGPTGLGKALVARWLAQVMLCESPIQDELIKPCGTCFSCTAITRDEHSDLVYLKRDPTKKRAQISVSQARKLIASVGLMPTYGKMRVVIIPEAELLTEDASNALLKTFEEPLTPTIFILVVSSSKYLLPTVRSRAQRIRFSPVPVEEMTEWFLERGLDCPRTILSLSQGCPGRALSLLQGEDQIWIDTVNDIKLMISQPLSELYDYTKAMFDIKTSDASFQKSQKFHRVLDVLEMLLRDVIVWQSTSDSRQLIWINEQDLIVDWSNKLDDRCVTAIHTQIEQGREDSKINVNQRLQLETLLVLLKRGLALGFV